MAVPDPTRRAVPTLATVLLAAGCASADPEHRSRADARAAGGAGIVSTATPEASEAGAEILAAGGNAVDAAVAVTLALAVTEPAGSGVGGQVMMLLHPPRGEPVVIHGSTLSPAATPPEPPEDGGLSGHRGATVPSCMKVLDTAWRRFGSGRVPWPALFGPAIRFAEDGYRLGRFRQVSLQRSAALLRHYGSGAALLLGADGAVPEEGARIRQPVLARTLRRLADVGADDFYRGAIAESIARDMEAHGGYIDRADLAAFPEPAVGPAVRGTYRGYDVYTLPPPTGGWVVLQALNVLEFAPAASLAAGHPDRAVWIAEALRAVHRGRTVAPVQDLENWHEDVADKISKERALRMLPKVPPDTTGDGETTHFSVVDADGFVASVTLSLNSYYGAKVASPELGFLYNDYMKEFVVGSPGHPFALRPRAMPYSSMSATVVAKDGRPVLALGSPGSRRIISAVVQVLSSWLDAGMPIDRAVDAPRLHVIPEDSAILTDAPLADRVVRELERRGFTLGVVASAYHRRASNPYFGGVHAVAARSPTEGWHGAADPRRDGAAVVVPRLRSR